MHAQRWSVLAGLLLLVSLPAHLAAATAPSQASPSGIGIQIERAGGGVRFVSWTEPREHSFSVDVPQGWTLSGGLNWTGPIDPQAFVRVQSPDGKVRIFLGDPEILPRQVPNQVAYLQTGATEGAVFQSPTGGRVLLQRFKTGTQFGKKEVVQARHCQNPRWVTESDLPDRARAINAALTPEARKWNTNISVSAGEAGFICGNVQGSVSATTVLGWGAGPTQAWFVQSVAVFLSADPMRSMQARYIMEHMMATAKADPQWLQAFEQRVLAKTGAVIKMQNAALQAQLSAAQSASTTLSRLNHPNPGVNVRPGERRPTSVNTILGTKDVCDAIGRCKNVSNDSETHFMDPSGNTRPGRAGGAPPDNSGVWSQTYVR